MYSESSPRLCHGQHSDDMFPSQFRCDHVCHERDGEEQNESMGIFPKVYYDPAARRLPY